MGRSLCCADWASCFGSGLCWVLWRRVGLVESAQIWAGMASAGVHFKGIFPFRLRPVSLSSVAFVLLQHTEVCVSVKSQLLFWHAIHSSRSVEVSAESLTLPLCVCDESGHAPGTGTSLRTLTNINASATSMFRGMFSECPCVLFLLRVTVMPGTYEP